MSSSWMFTLTVLIHLFVEDLFQLIKVDVSTVVLIEHLECFGTLFCSGLQLSLHARDEFSLL